MYTACYVLPEFGTGVVMGVPAHDQRDWDFASDMNLPVRKVVEPVDRYNNLGTKLKRIVTFLQTSLLLVMVP